MKKGSRVVFALTGLSVLCVCTAMATPMGMSDGSGRGGMMNDNTKIRFGPETAPGIDDSEDVQELSGASDVETVGLEAALESGDPEVVRAFLEESRSAEAPAMNEERMNRPNRNLQENSADTTGLETALESGDENVVRAFLEESRPADTPAMNEERMDPVNGNLQGDSIESIDLETALESGDPEVVRAFLVAN